MTTDLNDNEAPKRDTIASLREELTTARERIHFLTGQLEAERQAKRDVTKRMDELDKNIKFSLDRAVDESAWLRQELGTVLRRTHTLSDTAAHDHDQYGNVVR